MLSYGRCIDQLMIGHIQRPGNISIAHHHQRLSIPRTQNNLFLVGRIKFVKRRNDVTQIHHWVTRTIRLVKNYTNEQSNNMKDDESVQERNESKKDP